MTNYSVELNSVTQIFGRRLIFNNINYKFYNGNTYGISGHNGSGKSTLSRIILGLVSPVRGKVIHKSGSNSIKHDALSNHIGFVAPYLTLYNEFTAQENISFFFKVRGLGPDFDYTDTLFEVFGLSKRKNDYLKTYSSGMLQRVKYIFALQHKPEVLLLDEPTSNLDNKGKDEVYKLINELGKERLILVASNEDTDLNLCSNILNVEDYKDKQ